MNRDTAPRGLSWLIGPAIAAIGAALLFAGPGRAPIPDAAPKIVPVALATHVTNPKPAMRTKAIQDVRVGERVLSRDQDTGRLVPGLVTEVYRRVSDHLRILEVRTASGSAVQELRTTDEHPFWVEGRGWLVAGELHVGDELLCPNGERAAVASTRRMEHPEGVPVFNFRVDVHHDYFVAQRGDVGAVLVHNADYTPNTVFRGLAEGENPAAGLTARAPGAGNSVASHVGGKKASQWISTTTDEAVARGRFGANGVVEIDLSKVGSEVVDLSNGIPGMMKGMLSNWARKMKEVLVKDFIPPEAIKKLD